VNTAYQVSSGHAGHFAQPKNISPNNILKTLSRRQKSAYHEFSKRFLCLAAESEQCRNEIKLVPGPWKTALELVNEQIGERAVIYLDAPYKRDEYSRYYHVLETLVKYDYPSSEFKGRTRSKKLGERFSTEFFTKTSSKVDLLFIQIIGTVLKAGMTCVWSYSSNGIASVIDVIDAVRKQIRCNVHLYGIPYQHQAQRKDGHKLSVTEYCIVFSPQIKN
jgi:adenine-specific DNA methylase